MADITVVSLADDRFRVTVAEGGTTTTHVVTVTERDRIGDWGTTELIDASFRFLLDREPKEAIMARFDLGVITQYFPEYPTEIGEYID